MPTTPMRLLFALLALWSCSFWGTGVLPLADGDDLYLKKQQIETEFAIWLASSNIQKTIVEKQLAGNYAYTLVMDNKGRVQTVYADDNPDALVTGRQNEMTRLLRTFKTSVRLKRDERIKFTPTIKL